MKKKVLIIGSGLGGLSAAINLAIIGFDVTIFEKNSTLGGKANCLKIDGFRFDFGPTLLTMPFVLENLFNLVGKDLNEYLKINRKDLICKYFFSDGTTFSEFSEKEKLLDEFERFTNEPRENLIRYIDYTRRIYNLTADLFLFSPFLHFKNFINPKGLKALLNINQIDAFRTVHQANSTFFKSNKIIQHFDRYATYNGSNPFRAPATLNIIPFVELEFGGYFVEGGMCKIVDALSVIAKELGVKIFTDSKVEKILIDGDKVVGLQIGNEKLNCDVVISNADVLYTYENLISNTSNKRVKKYFNQELSTSAVIFYWGVKGNSNSLEMDNILFSENYEEEFNQLFYEKVVPDDPTIHIHISSKKVKEDAPEGFENWYVMINAPSKKDAAQNINQVKDTILNKIKRMTGIDLKDKIVIEKITTPTLLENFTSSYNGSLYGQSSNNRYSAFLRQKNKSKFFKGLYFCGGTVHPGGGIPLVLLSGKITAELIESYER